MPYSLNTTTYRSPNYNERPAGVAVDSLVIHTTEGYWSGDANWLCNPDSGVSCHYVIPPTGTIVYQLVPDNRRAWHAGESTYNGRSDWNDFSLGLEISHVDNQPWPQGQQDLFAALARYLIDRYHIPQANVVAHRWIATPQGRKSDPTDWPDDKFKKWIASLYAPQFVPYRVVSPCAVFTARDPASPLAGGPDDGQTWLDVGDVITVGDVTGGWLWISPNTTDPPGIGFIPQSYAKKV